LAITLGLYVERIESQSRTCRSAAPFRKRSRGGNNHRNLPPTLQKDRLLGNDRFPFYRSGGRILYDLEEVVAAIRASRAGSSKGIV
jgi:hypothetical protein